MCEAIVGFDDEPWGFVKSDDGQLTYFGTRPEAIQNLVESMQTTDQDPDALVQSLEKRLTGRVWALQIYGDNIPDDQAQKREEVAKMILSEPVAEDEEEAPDDTEVENASDSIDGL